MKIKMSTLKKIIAEEVAKAGVSGPSSRLSKITGGAALQSALDSICDDWLDQYDPGDPSMVAAGRDEWAAQVKNACDVLDAEVAAIIEKVEEMLYNGEFSNR